MICIEAATLIQVFVVVIGSALLALALPSAENYLRRKLAALKKRLHS